MKGTSSGHSIGSEDSYPWGIERLTKTSMGPPSKVEGPKEGALLHEAKAKQYWLPDTEVVTLVMVLFSH